MPRAWADLSHCNVLVTVHHLPGNDCLGSFMAIREQQALILLAVAAGVMHALSLLGRTTGLSTACCCRLCSACAILARPNTDISLRTGRLHAANSVSHDICKLQLCPHHCDSGHCSHLLSLVPAQIRREACVSGRTAEIRPNTIWQG